MKPYFNESLVGERTPMGLALRAVAEVATGQYFENLFYLREAPLPCIEWKRRCRAHHETNFI
jgi:hypothetical protein